MVFKQNISQFLSPSLLPIGCLPYLSTYISLPIFRYCASNILPFISSICRGLEKTPEDKKMIAYVVEDRNLGTLGRDIVFYASKRYPQLETRRMDWMYARNSIFQYRSLPLPSVILVPVDQNTVDWFVYTYIHLFCLLFFTYSLIVPSVFTAS